MEQQFSFSKKSNFEQIRKEACFSMREAFGFDFDTLVEQKENPPSEEISVLSDSVERGIVTWNKSWTFIEAMVNLFDNFKHHFQFEELEYHRKQMKASWNMKVLTRDKISFEMTISVSPIGKRASQIHSNLSEATVVFSTSLAQRNTEGIGNFYKEFFSKDIFSSDVFKP